MKVRAYCDTSVVLRVAYDEGASPALTKLVREGVARRGAIDVVLVAPVLSELFTKYVAEAKQVETYTEKIQSVINLVRPKPAPSGRSQEVGRAELNQFAAGLEEQLVVIGPYPERRRARIITILSELRKHAHVTDFVLDDVADAFAQEDRLRAQVRKRQPERKDLLVLATVLRHCRTSPGVFLTTDERLRELAVEHDLESPDPEVFANHE